MKIIYKFRTDSYHKVVSDGVLRKLTEQQAKQLVKQEGATLVQRNH